MPEPLTPPPVRPLTERDPLVPAVDDAADPAPPPAFNRSADQLRGPAPADAELGSADSSFSVPRATASSTFRGFEPDGTASSPVDEVRGLAEAWIRENREAALLGSFALGVVIGVLLRR